MRFSMNSKKRVSGLLAACLALPLVGCSPETSSTPAGKPVTGTSGMSKPPQEQAGSTTSGSVEKGREAPEPSPAAANAEEKPASEKPKEE